MADAAPRFIPYAGPDRPIAERLRIVIRDAGLTPWCDAVDQLPHQQWDDVIPGELRRAALLAALILRHCPVVGEAGDGDYGPEGIARTIHQARRQGTKLVPVRPSGIGRARDRYGPFRAIEMPPGGDLDAAERAGRLDPCHSALQNAVSREDQGHGFGVRFVRPASPGVAE